MEVVEVGEEGRETALKLRSGMCFIRRVVLERRERWLVTDSNLRGPEDQDAASSIGC